jgi:hypothetical protein
MILAATKKARDFVKSDSEVDQKRNRETLQIQIEDSFTQQDQFSELERVLYWICRE